MAMVFYRTTREDHIITISDYHVMFMMSPSQKGSHLWSVTSIINTSSTTKVWHSMTCLVPKNYILCLFP